MLTMARLWTEEENDFIEAHAGARSIQWIAEKLNRPIHGLRVQMIKLGVGDLHVEAGTLSASALSQIIGVSYEAIRRWIVDKSLPAKKKSRYTGVDRANMHYHISPDDFWRWAAKHKSFVEFNKIEPDSLPPEPSWVAEERRKQYNKPAKQKIWTTEEDVTLLNYYYKDGLKQREIAVKLNRTQSSVEKRLKRLREMGEVC